MFKFRDIDTDGKMKVYVECENPAFIIDKQLHSRIRYGERDELPNIFPDYKMFGYEIVDAPKDQDLLDQLFQGTMFFQAYYRKLDNDQNEKDAASYASIYSVIGLNEMINDSKNSIVEKEKQFILVCEGKLWNPACSEFHKQELNAQIKNLECDIKIFEKALKLQEVLTSN